jgi:hypothetical protein
VNRVPHSAAMIVAKMDHFGGVPRDTLKALDGGASGLTTGLYDSFRSWRLGFLRREMSPGLEHWAGA